MWGWSGLAAAILTQNPSQDGVDSTGYSSFICLSPNVFLSFS